MVTIRGWIKMKKIKYLQDRNPGVRDLFINLNRKKTRKENLKMLSRKLWDCVIDINGAGLKDIYSATYREQNMR